jgi:hypothetical protein
MLQAVGGFAQSALPYAQMVGTIGGAWSRYQQGREAEAAAGAEASQFEARANQTRALGSLQAARLRKANAAILARQRAVLAASGFSASDVGATALTEATVKEATIEELLAVAQSEDEARQDEFRAKLRRAQGADARSASKIDAGLALVSGFTSWRDRFGKPSGDANGDGIGHPWESRGGGAPLPMSRGSQTELEPLY